jgi:hypothetical protein
MKNTVYHSFKANPVAETSVGSLSLLFDRHLPGNLSEVESRQAFRDEAARIASLLQSHLPQGLLEHLMAELMTRRASVLHVPADAWPVHDIELRSAQDQIQLARERLRLAEESDRRNKADAFIAANGLTRSMIWPSTGTGLPWWGHVNEFVKWIARQPEERPYFEWNGRVWCFVTQIPTPVLYDEVPE